MGRPRVVERGVRSFPSPAPEASASPGMSTCRHPAARVGAFWLGYGASRLLHFTARDPGTSPWHDLDRSLSPPQIPCERAPLLQHLQ